MDAFVVVEEFKHLDFNRQEQHALAIYKKDGVVVPYKGLFDPIGPTKKRPKI
jgi:hypothetical protein